ncbi:MAG: SHOCT domain-containing protein [Bacteroidales bacterium]|nr:SHOCT domain-containing protein [Bacteroidales bacterium]
MHGFGGMGLGMAWWWIIGLVLVAAIIWVVIRSTGQNNNTNNAVNQNTSLDILNERYARGEIDKEEYEIKKRDLGV